MTRPIYENDDHRRAEREMAERVAQTWNCGIVKLPELSVVDWVLTGRNGRVTRAFMECKNRATYSWEFFERNGGVFCSERKWNAARELCREADVPFVFVIQVDRDELWYSRVVDWSHDGIVEGGRTDRGDPRDIEPCVLLRRRRFAPLLAAPLSTDQELVTADMIRWS